MKKFTKLQQGLSKTRTGLVKGIGRILKSSSRIDENTLDEIEELLILSDVGLDTTEHLIERLREKYKDGIIDNEEEVFNLFKAILAEELNSSVSANDPENVINTKPHVISVIGVNGTGKTTSIGKLAGRYQQKNYNVLLAAADTFRAAATEQLSIWGERVRSDIIKTSPGGDPAAVAFDAVNAAKARHKDILIIDTAGRLHTKSNLMQELQKIHRVLDKAMPGAPHEILLVIDANTGQNGLAQARTFMQAVGVTGIILTKLDGTAKGGIVFSIQKQLKVPVKYIGIGEKPDDLQRFDPGEFVEALFQ
ncbi:signal recognition particle-docking protein FtsY [candidate division KSB1 bacterium]|nr:signal recognition particle-docking protein FtsY [candidate division KSB1 bacterium]